MFENLSIIELLKTVFSVLWIPVAGVITYMYTEIRGIKSDLLNYKIEVAKDYVTKLTVKEIEESILRRMDDHKRQTSEQHMDVSRKLDQISDQIFDLAKGNK